MQLFETVASLRDYLAPYRQQRIGFVPTMGNLHAGHISLVEAIKPQVDIVIASIFVNPLQFGAGEDLDSYPRTLEADCEKLKAVGVSAVFTPTPDIIYPHGMETHTLVTVPEVTNDHCGASRPGHFDGVSTIVTKLFNIVQPDVAAFGEKDFQQLAVIRKMVNDLLIPIEVVGVPIKRDHDGLALSSRNGYLSEEEREIAPNLYQVLTGIKSQILHKNRQDYDKLEQEATQALEKYGFKVDYFTICNSETLKKTNLTPDKLVILAAAYIGNTRLIDNITLE